MLDQGPFSLLGWIAGDPAQAETFSRTATVASWLAAERALALAQAHHGIIDPAEAAAIAEAARSDTIDEEALWASARNVGYPILGLVRAIAARLPEGPNGRVHLGATTQDIMDTGLALQLDRSLAALDADLRALGDRVVEHVVTHASTVMSARTHGQAAVPTTFGATLATLLGQLTRHRQRLAQARPRVAVVSLFGAGGTSAASGPLSTEVRRTAAEILGLVPADIPWHVARDGVAEFGWLCVTISASCSRFARNIVDLSRTEIGEVAEEYAPHRGVSSTMPQKVNPISSELIVGAGIAAGSLAGALARIQEAGHERAAGEWQAEWHVIPQLAYLAGSALAESVALVEGLRVDSRRMRANLDNDNGLIMAEAAMMRLTGPLGRERAHDLVYAAASRARSDGTGLEAALRIVAAEAGLDRLVSSTALDPIDYLGEAERICAVAVAEWRAGPASWPAPPALEEVARASWTGPPRARSSGRRAGSP